MIRVLRLYLKYLGVHLLCKGYTLLMVIWKVCIHKNKLSLIISYHCHKLSTFMISKLVYKIIFLVIKDYNTSRVGLYTVGQKAMFPNHLKIFGVNNVRLLKKDNTSLVDQYI